MTITLSAETQKLLEDKMKAYGFDNPDDALRDFLQDLDEVEVDRSPETIAAIHRGIAQSRAGQVRSWEDVKKDLKARHPQI